jgi:hypothetical protein
MNDARNVRRTPKTSYLTIRSWGTALDHEQSTFHTADLARLRISLPAWLALRRWAGSARRSHGCR